jgi:hypothetical protein
MNQKNQRPAILSLARELSQNEQKKILGGLDCYESGLVCAGSNMNCTTSQITVAYCEAVWHSSEVDSCYIYYEC